MGQALRILITNIWLDQRHGSETVVRDLALGLMRRGHQPIVYSPTLGEVAAEIAGHGVPVIDDLRELTEQPDILHGHHTIPAGEALIRFPSLPAIQVCHSFTHWAEAPLHFPQIARYVSVDAACFDRLAGDGIAADRIVTIRNAVDLARVPERPAPLNERPLRIAAFGKAAAVPQIRKASETLGIAFDAMGTAETRMVACPERELVAFDLVFASARAALEAACCGCAVIVCDARGMAGMLTSANYATWREKNFGLRTLTEPATVERCVAAIARYDRDDAARVTEAARRDADLETALDRYEALYAEVLREAPPAGFDRDRHNEAVARFLHENLPRRPYDPRWPWVAEHIQTLERDSETALLARNDAFDQLAELGRTLVQVHAERDEARRQLVASNGQRAELEQRLVASEGRRTELERRLVASDGQRTELERQLAASRGESAQRQSELAAVTLRFAAANAQRAALQSSLDTIKRSRLLKLGRLLRRVMGRETPY